MKFLILALALVLLATPALAQTGGSSAGSGGTVIEDVPAYGVLHYEVTAFTSSTQNASQGWIVPLPSYDSAEDAAFCIAAATEGTQENQDMEDAALAFLIVARKVPFGGTARFRCATIKYTATRGEVASDPVVIPAQPFVVPGG